MRRIHVERKSGQLHIHRGEDHARVFFVIGQIAWGSTTLRECRMGECLVRHGQLSQWDFECASEVVVRTGRKLGQVLLEMGVLDETGLEEALALHVREILLTVFSWSEGSWEFEDHPEDRLATEKPLRLSTAEVILDAVWSLTDPRAVLFALGDLDRILTATADERLSAQRVTLVPEDVFMLSRVDGATTARELLEIVPVDRPEAERRLLALLCTGILRYRVTEERPGTPSLAALPPLLGRLHAERQTGLLNVRRGSERVSLCLVRGDLAWADTDVRECRFGETLVRLGWLTESDRERASGWVDCTGRRFGQVLVDMGIFDESSLRDALALHVREIMRMLLSWRGEGSWDLDERSPEDLRGFDRPLSVSLTDVILRAARALPALEVHQALGGLQECLRVTEDVRLQAESLTLGPKEAFVLSRLDGEVRTEDLLSVIPGSREEAERSLVGLLWLGMVEICPKKARSAPARRVASSPPPRPLAPAPAPPSPAVEAAPPAPRAAAPPRSAEEILSEAEETFKAGHYWDALAAVDDLLPRTSGTVRGRIHLLRARVYLKSPARTRDAEHELRELLEKYPAHAEATYLLGVIAKRTGAAKRAQALFRKVLELEPDHAAAAAELAAFTRETSAPSGLLRRLLSRS